MLVTYIFSSLPSYRSDTPLTLSAHYCMVSADDGRKNPDD